MTIRHLTRRATYLAGVIVEAVIYFVAVFGRVRRQFLSRLHSPAVDCALTAMPMLAVMASKLRDR